MKDFFRKHKHTYAYHCYYCGAPISDLESTNCEYCGRSIKVAIPKPRNIIKISLSADKGLRTPRKFYLENVISFATTTDNIGDIYRDEKGMLHRPRTEGLVTGAGFDLAITTRTVDVLDFMHSVSDVTLRIDFMKQKQNSIESLVLPGYVGSMSLPAATVNAIMTTHFDFYGSGDGKQIVRNEFLHTCPNCGGPLNSLLGTCDYCGGITVLKDWSDTDEN